jgi:hypothetical protein
MQYKLASPQAQDAYMALTYIDNHENMMQLAANEGRVDAVEIKMSRNGRIGQGDEHGHWN